jgi:hypothetical protein
MTLWMRSWKNGPPICMLASYISPLIESTIVDYVLNGLAGFERKALVTRSPAVHSVFRGDEVFRDAS